MLCSCQAGFEDLLAQELAAAGAVVQERGPAWVLAAGAAPPPELVFAHQILPAPTEIRGESVNALAQEIFAAFASSLRGERLEAPWPNCWQHPPEVAGLGRRTGAVADAFDRSCAGSWRGSPSSPTRACRARRARPAAVRLVCRFRAGLGFPGRLVNGPRRMADDALAPSRSYLKLEEAYVVFGREPAPGKRWPTWAPPRGAGAIARPSAAPG